MEQGFLHKKFFWVSLAIASIWAAVALVGIYGPELVINSAGGDEVRIPAGVIFASFFAATATVFVAVWGYRGAV
ncbi:hypothetical protein ACFLX9_02320 [Chloroflexota bacterium]